MNKINFKNFGKHFPHGLTTNGKVWKLLFMIFTIMTLFFWLCFYFSMIFVTLVVGFALIVLSERMIKDYRARMRKYKFSRMQKIILGTMLVIFWTIVIGMLLGDSLADMGSVVSDFRIRQSSLIDTYLSNISPYVPDFIEENILNDNTFENIGNYFVSFMSSILSNISLFIINAILIIPILFYMYYKRRHELAKRIDALIPKKHHESFRMALSDIGRELHDYFEAKLIESIVVGAICCLGFYVAGLKGWLLFGMFAGLLNIIPYVGPWIGAVPPLLIGLMESPTLALYVLITIVVAQVIDNIYLIPFMISNRVRMNPLWTVILLLLSAQLFGALGMIFCIPFYLVYKIVLRDAYVALASTYVEKNKK